MKIVMIGAGASGWYCCKRLIKVGYQISGIVSLDKSTAKSKSTFKSYEDIAYEYGIEIIKTSNINEVRTITKILEWKPDLIIEMGWSQIIGLEVLNIPRLGTIGTHISRLPYHKGHSPINWAIIRGEKIWANTLYYLDEKIDNGDIISQRDFFIEDRDDAATIYNKATFLGIEMVLEVLPKIQAGSVNRRKQENVQDRKLPKRKPSDGLIVWDEESHVIVNLIRSLVKPFPGAFSYYNGKKIYIWKASVIIEDSNMKKNNKKQPGLIMELIHGKGVVVSTGSGPILIERISVEDDMDIWADDYHEFTSYEKSFFSNSEK